MERSNDIAELDATMSSTDVDSSFDVVSANTCGVGNSQPLPRMTAHTRVVRPRVEPRRILRNGVPTFSNGVSSSNVRCPPQLRVSNLLRNSEIVPQIPECPQSITWLSVDDLTLQPPPPGGQVRISSLLRQHHQCHLHLKELWRPT